MALTLTEVMVVPGTGDRVLAIWKVTGDGSSYQINVAELKLSVVKAAWTENISNETKLIVRVDNYDYIDGTVTVIELGEDGGALGNGNEHLLFLLGY